MLLCNVSPTAGGRSRPADGLRPTVDWFGRAERRPLSEHLGSPALPPAPSRPPQTSHKLCVAIIAVKILNFIPSDCPGQPEVQYGRLESLLKYKYRCPGFQEIARSPPSRRVAVDGNIDRERVMRGTASHDKYREGRRSTLTSMAGRADWRRRGRSEETVADNLTCRPRQLFPGERVKSRTKTGERCTNMVWTRLTLLQ